jgi:hypothetical protein
MKHVLTGRVDLVRALAAGGTELQQAMARLLRMDYQEPPRAVPSAPIITGIASSSDAPITEPTRPTEDVRFIPFWYARSFEVQPGALLA